jgi:hypothetical protein
MATSSDYATRREPHEASVGEGSLAHLFGVPFLSQVWPDSDELNHDLRRRILARERDATARSVTKSNVGGWQSDSGGLEWCGEAGKVLGERMLAMANDATRQLLIFHGRQLPGSTWSGIFSPIWCRRGSSSGQRRERWCSFRPICFIWCSHIRESAPVFPSLSIFERSHFLERRNSGRERRPRNLEPLTSTRRRWQQRQPAREMST